jgi:hypothetical protein
MIGSLAVCAGVGGLAVAVAVGCVCVCSEIFKAFNCTNYTINLRIWVVTTSLKKKKVD